MPTECSQTNIPSKNTHRGDGTAERCTPVTREESDVKLSYRWKQHPEKVCFFDHLVTKIITPLEHKGFAFRESKLDLSPSSGLQEERL